MLTLNLCLNSTLGERLTSHLLEILEFLVTLKLKKNSKSLFDSILLKAVAKRENKVLILRRSLIEFVSPRVLLLPSPCLITHLLELAYSDLSLLM